MAVDGGVWVVSEEGKVIKWDGKEWVDTGLGNAKEVAAGRSEELYALVVLPTLSGIANATSKVKKMLSQALKIALPSGFCFWLAGH